MDSRTKLTRRAALLALSLAGATWLARSAVAEDPELELRAFAVNMGGGAAAADAQMLDIVIERWTTDAEHERLHGILVEKSSDKLLGALDDIEPRVGYIRTSTSLGWDIQYARRKRLPDGGQRVVFLTDRPMSFYERSRQPRSAEYEFIFAEIRIGPDGEGQGKLVPAAKVYYDPVAREVQIENYNIEPVRLTRVTVEKQTARK